MNFFGGKMYTCFHLFQSTFFTSMAAAAVCGRWETNASTFLLWTVAIRSTSTGPLHVVILMLLAKGPFCHERVVPAESIHYEVQGGWDPEGSDAEVAVFEEEA